jgi:hypothetical protein
VRLLPTLLIWRLLMWRLPMWRLQMRSHAARQVWCARLHRISMTGALRRQGSRAPAEAVDSGRCEPILVMLVIVALGLGLRRLRACGEALLLLLLVCMGTVCRNGLRLRALAEASYTPRRVSVLGRPPMVRCWSMLLLLVRSRRTRIWVLRTAGRSSPVEMTPCLRQLLLNRKAFVLAEPSVVWTRHPTRHTVGPLASAACDWSCPLLLRDGPWAESSNRRASGTRSPWTTLKSFRLFVLLPRTPVLLGQPLI